MKNKKNIKLNSINEIPPVTEIPIIINNRDTLHKAIVNADTNETIVIVPSKYQFIPHRVVAEQASQIEGLTITDIILMDNGKRLYLELASKEKFELLPQDYIERRVRIINYYDRNACLKVEPYAIRLVCTNGMTAARVLSQHRIQAFGKNIFKGEIEQAIKESFEAWLQVKPLLEKAQQTVISVKNFIAEFGNILPKKYMKLVLDNLGERETVYDIWNQLTYVISHHLEPKVQKQCLIGAQKKVNKILSLALTE